MFAFVMCAAICMGVWVCLYALDGRLTSYTRYAYSTTIAELNTNKTGFISNAGLSFINLGTNLTNKRYSKINDNVGKGDCIHNQSFTLGSNDKGGKGESVIV